MVSVTSSGISLVDGLLVEAQQHEEAILAPLGLRKSKMVKQVLQELIERYSPDSSSVEKIIRPKVTKKEKVKKY
ncbi:TPA: hypothetical protein ACKRTE_002639 [Providencia rettgeri]